MPKGILADDFRVQTYRGQPVLTWWEGKTNPRGYGQGTWVIADTSYREIARVKAVGDVGGDLHDIELTDEGTALIPIYKIVPQDLTPIGAYADGEAIDSVIQEIDLETGELVWEWSSLEHVGLTESLAGIPQKTALPVRLLPHQLDRRRQRRQPARLRAQHLGDLQAGPQDRRGHLAPRRLSQRLRARRGRALRLAARRAPPARRHADAVRQPGHAEGRAALARADAAPGRGHDARDGDEDPRAPGRHPLDRPGQLAGPAGRQHVRGLRQRPARHGVRPEDGCASTSASRPTSTPTAATASRGGRARRAAASGGDALRGR